MKYTRTFFTMLTMAAVAVGFSSCSDDDDPPIENQEEEITRVVATFVNVDNGADIVTAEWLDADGEGSGAPVIDDITLAPNTTYTMSLTLENTLESPVEDITVEVEEEDDEHMFFFGFTDALFSDPSGDGNIDNRQDPVNYEDMDDNMQPVGLVTTWTTGDAATGSLRIVLKHQPDIKSATSTADDGESDVDISFDVTVE
jgi:hypothetical protein